MLRYRSLIAFLALSICLAVGWPSVSHAVVIDRRLKLLGKTSAIGALGGTALGAAVWGLGLIKAKGMFVGTSLGFYAGVLGGAYLIATPSKRVRYPDPSLPRQSVPQRYDDDDELEDDEMHEIAPPPPPTPRNVPDGPNGFYDPRERKFRLVVWVPLLLTEF